MAKVAFYCRDCELDYETDKICHSVALGGIRKFNSKCVKCGRKQYRLRDNIADDPFYFLSNRVIIERAKYAKDLIQPGQEGFQLYYAKEWKKMEEAAERLEQQKQREKEMQNEFYKQANGVDKKVITKALEAEEEIKYGKK